MEKSDIFQAIYRSSLVLTAEDQIMRLRQRPFTSITYTCIGESHAM